jgi:2-oxo-4-hydroxy-4-carboxy-5-ureidoimidazoline decarboxylase
VAEHSPWVAEEAFARRPFGTAAELERALATAIFDAPLERRLALVRAHPELGGGGAGAAPTQLTADSDREQRRAGLRGISEGEGRELAELNRAYRERFGFPLVICVGEHTPESILAWGRARLGRAPEDELETALGEVVKIVRLRVRERLAA